MKIDEVAKVLKLSRRAALAALKRAGIAGTPIDRGGRSGRRLLDYPVEAVEALRLKRLAEAEAHLALLRGE